MKTTDVKCLEELIGQTALVIGEVSSWTIHAVRIDHHKEVFVELIRHDPGSTYRHWEPLWRVSVV